MAVVCQSPKHINTNELYMYVYTPYASILLLTCWTANE
jgi:hypothetical protein